VVDSKVVWGDRTVAVYRYRTMFPVLRLQAPGRLGRLNGTTGTPALRSLTPDDHEPHPLDSTIEGCFEPMSHEGEPPAHGAVDASPME
jgi:hypothetical protein